MTNVISEADVQTAIPTVEMERVEMAVVTEPLELMDQTVLAFGSPSEARRLGTAAVDEHDEALRRLAES
jgi:hypothetical protein